MIITGSVMMVTFVPVVIDHSNDTLLKYNITEIMANNDNLTTNSSSPPVTWDCIVFRFVVYTLIMGVMCVVGFVGNSLAILVLRRDRTTVVASFLLQCLAVADNCYLAVWLLNFAIRDLFK